MPEKFTDFHLERRKEKQKKRGMEKERVIEGGTEVQKNLERQETAKREKWKEVLLAKREKSIEGWHQKTRIVGM